MLQTPYQPTLSLERLRLKRDAALHSFRWELDSVSVSSRCDDSVSTTDQSHIDSEIEATQQELHEAKKKLREIERENEDLKANECSMKVKCVLPSGGLDRLDAGDGHSVSSYPRSRPRGPTGARASEAASQEDISMEKSIKRRLKQKLRHSSLSSWGSRGRKSSASTVATEDTSKTLEEYEKASRKDRETIRRLKSELNEVRTSFQEEIQTLQEENSSLSTALSSLTSTKNKLELTFRDQYDRLTKEHRVEVERLKSKIESRDATITSLQNFLKKIRQGLVRNGNICARQREQNPSSSA